ITEGHTPLFARDGRSLFFLRSGQIWMAEIAATSGAEPGQLVFDRGSDSQLTLSPNGSQLAFISRRDHDHDFLALFDLRTKTLRFPAASTGNDSAPAFSPDGKQLAWLRAPFTDTPEFASNRVSANPWSIQVLDLTSGSVHSAYTPTANQKGSVLPHLSTGEP